MTTERAIEILDPTHREHYDSLETVNEACRMGMQALEKQIPKKPIFNWGAFHYCPTCIDINEHVSYDYLVDKGTKYCWRCGQALDWSE